MSKDVDNNSILNDHLAAIDDLLVEATAESIDWSLVSEHFSAIDGYADMEVRECTEILNQLAEFAEYTLGDENAFAGTDSTELIGSLNAGAQLLKASLGGDKDCQEDLQAVVTGIQKRWGESLCLLGDDDRGGDEDEWFDQSFDFSDERQPDADEEESAEPGAPSADEVSRLLQALADGSAVEETANGDSLFDDNEQQTSVSTDPLSVPDPPKPERVEMGPDLLEAYLDDVNNGLSSMERALLECESNPQDKQPLQQICRELHTLKGASASVGLQNLASYLHAVEDVIDAQIEADGGVEIDMILACVDAVRAQNVTLSQPEGVADAATPQSAASGSASPAGFASDLEGSSSNREETVRVKASQLDRLMDMLAELVMLRNRRETSVDQLKATNEELLRCAVRVRGFSDDNGAGRYSEYDSRQTVVGDDSSTGVTPATSSFPRTKYLSELGNDLTEITRGIRDLYKPVAEENQAVSRFIRQFRQELMQLRRMSVSGLFQRLQRSVRDAARVENKQVQLRLVGANSGLERSLQERLYEPLLHLVRNSVSHGIETPEQRKAAGKEPSGTITLEASGGPNRLILEVRDDGRGLDYDAIHRRGLERGLLSIDRRPSRKELAKLIFHPGFSTKDETSEISGRGVGMDVVAATLDRLHARIDVESEPGTGTTIRLTIPLHSAIEHTLVVRVSGQLFALPTQFVRTVGSKTSHDGSAESQAIHLADVLGLPRVEQSVPNGVLSVGVSGASQVTLAVDQIVGPEEVVVRSLPAMLKRHRLFSGATLSGASETVLLLDPQQLIEIAQTDRTSNSANELGESTPSTEKPTRNDRKRVLVVDDSLSARRFLIQKLKTQLNCEITEAGDGTEGLACIRDQSFDYIFTDLEMPRTSGLELLEAVRTNPATADLPVVIVTSRDEEKFQAPAHALNANGYLIKPVKDAALAGVILELKTNSALAGANSLTESLQ